MTNAGNFIELDQDGDLIRLFLQPGNRRSAFLDQKTLDELEQSLTDLENDPPDALLISSRDSTNFCPGANVEELANIQTREDAYEFSRNGQTVLQKIADLPSLTVAALNGNALGGGLELALSCDGIVLIDNPDAGVGLPEVKLGIIPGFGGTQRLPRKIGIQDALRVILTGRKYTPRQARKFGIVDKIAPRDGFLHAASMITRSWLDDPPSFSHRGEDIWSNLLEETGPGQSLVFKQARSKTKERTGSNYPAPFAAIDAVEQGFESSLEEGLEVEATKVSELVEKPVTRNLINLFIKSEGMKDLPEQVKDYQWESSGVIGAGVMGGGIAQLFSYKKYPCRLKDIESEPLRQGLFRAREIFEKGIRDGRWTESYVEDHLQLISPTLKWDGFQNADVLIEAVPEVMDIKKGVLRDMEDHSGSDTIIATNTSSLSLSELATTLDQPGKFVGIHFFNPVYKMPLVEVITHENTSEDTLQKARKIVKDLGKTPVVVKSSPGFLVNRLLFFYLQEALLLYHEGVSIERIDSILKEFGMPQGPFEVMDQVGLDIAQHVAETMSDAFEGRTESITVIDTLVEKGWLGKKSEIGFYRYSGKDTEPNLELGDLVRRSSREPDDEEIQDRAVLSLVNEAVRCLQEGIISEPDAVDVAMVLGTGFAPFRGGPWTYAKNRGWSDVRERLHQLENRHGSRFKPADGFPEPENSNRNRTEDENGEASESNSDNPEHLADSNPDNSSNDKENNDKEKEERETDENPDSEVDNSDIRNIEKTDIVSAEKKPEKFHRPEESIGLVFSGGGARGAYEAGVLSGLQKYIFSELDGRPNINIIVGTSAGAVNAFYLAGRLNDMEECTREMENLWQNLTLEDSLVPTSMGTISLIRWIIGRPQSERVGILDPQFIKDIIRNEFPWERIQEHQNSGLLDSLCVTATTLNTGTTTLFVDSVHEELPPLPYEQQVEWEPTQIQPVHIFASSSIPLFYPATRIDGRLFYDGGLRQNVPITPSVALGADKIFVFGVKSPEPEIPEEIQDLHKDTYPGAPHIIGKIMDAILLDPVERERRRLFVLKQLIRDGEERYGKSFSERVSELLVPYVGGNLSNTEFYFHRPDSDLGAMAKDYVGDISDRIGGLWGRMFQQVATGKAPGDWDLASYMLFDGEYTGKLIREGKKHVLNHKEEILDFFES